MGAGNILRVPALKTTMRIQQYLPATIPQFVRIYLAAVAFFTLFRLILFASEYHRVDGNTYFSDVVWAFEMGVRFDLVISGYILALPFVVLTVFSYMGKAYPMAQKLAFNYIYTLFSLAFLVCAIDIPYFNHFFARLTVTVLEWVDSPAFVVKMIVQEPAYWLSIIPLVLIVYGFIRVVKKYAYRPGWIPTKPTALHLVFSLLFLGLIFLGIRGRIEIKSPIRVGTAYFCNNAFLNQLGLNPNFTLIRSYLDSRKPENKRIQLLPDSVALAQVQAYLHVNASGQPLPFSRPVAGDSLLARKHNVVFVIMESMSAAKMQRHGNPERLTPFLDSLSNEGLYFENAYTAGIHTFNGIFSTLFSYPAIFRQHPMKEGSLQPYDGVFRTLKAHDYSTIYFTTHDGQFDNVEGFMKSNDCETVITKSDYPSDKVKTTLGVPDDYMFEYSIPVLNKLADKNKPFCAAFMTASDHGPYYIPEYFKPQTRQIKTQIVEYADFALRRFLTMAARQSWFKNTIFVFVADHGAPLDGLYDMSLDYNHSPLLFYAPEILKEPRVYAQMAGQIDAFPSVMGLLHLPYTNNTLGIDLFSESRPYIFFNGDDKYGVIDQDWFLIVRSDKSKSLYQYRKRDTHNFAAEKPEMVERMDDYAKAHLQAYQWVMRRK